MSLINKMLVDLDTRRIASGATLPAEDICHDLRPVTRTEPRPRRAQWHALIVLAAGLAGVVIWGEWDRRSSQQFAEATARTEVATAALPAIVPAAPLVITEQTAAPEIAAMVAGDATQPVARFDDAPTQPQPKEPELELIPVPHAVPSPASPIAPAAVEAEPSVVDKKVRVLTAEQKAENAYRLALEQYRNRQSDRAELSLRDALGAAPAHVQARELLAGLLLEAGRPADAAQILVEGLAQQPSHYPFASMLAGIYVEQGRESTALETLVSTQAYARGDAEYLGFLATLYQRAGHHADAIESYRAALSLKAFVSKWWLGAGISYEAVRDWAAAENAFTRAQKDGGLTPALSRYADERLREIRGHAVVVP